MNALSQLEKIAGTSVIVQLTDDDREYISRYADLNELWCSSEDESLLGFLAERIPTMTPSNWARYTRACDLLYDAIDEMFRAYNNLLNAAQTLAAELRADDYDDVAVHVALAPHGALDGLWAAFPRLDAAVWKYALPRPMPPETEG